MKTTEELQHEINLEKIKATGYRNMGFHIGSGIAMAGFWVGLAYYLTH